MVLTKETLQAVTSVWLQLKEKNTGETHGAIRWGPTDIRYRDPTHKSLR
jgi:hypothetical protein